MKSKKIILAGAFSFCLPGLGQLFLNRPLSSVVFFTLFIIAELNPPYLKGLPVIALISSLEAFMTGDQNWPLNKYSIYLYSFSSFIILTALTAPSLLLNTITGVVRKSGLNSRSQLT